MTKLWKFTDEKDQTYGGCQWGEGVEHRAPGRGELCGPGWLHAYMDPPSTDPLLAVFINPIYANFQDPHLWEAEGDVGKTDDGLKVGCTRLKTIRRVDLPKVTLEQRVRFGILCAMRVCEDKAWKTWAEKWLSGEDRSRKVARIAGWAIEVVRAAQYKEDNLGWSPDVAALAAARLAADAATTAQSPWTTQVGFEVACGVDAAAQAAGTPLPLAEIAREAVNSR